MIYIMVASEKQGTAASSVLSELDGAFRSLQSACKRSGMQTFA